MEKRSPEFLVCVRLLRRLDEIIAEGNGDGPEADAVRSQMEEPWYAMTEGEQHLLDLLSADVCTLWKATPLRQAPKAEARAGFDAALRTEDWREVLAALHRAPGLAEAPQAALMRAQAWRALGHPDLADEFIALARRLLDIAPPRNTAVRRRRATPMDLPTFRSAGR
ncbi:MAG TPA: hypothetical protein VHN14_32890 [Kofleriaceae bacterium]|nr:hypothetical protein [Kofleriaceae bacterium]